MLNHDLMTSIDAKASDILRDAYQGSAVVPPIDLQKIAQLFVLDLCKGAFREGDVVGCYDRAKKHIAVSVSDSPERQAFAIAHELGHHALHHHKTHDVFSVAQTLQFDAEPDQEEAEANWFAACLLLPRDVVKKLWGPLRTPQEIAQVFHAPEALVLWRLQSLSLV